MIRPVVGAIAAVVVVEMAMSSYGFVTTTYVVEIVLTVPIPSYRQAMQLVPVLGSLKPLLSEPTLVRSYDAS